jgi:hypothetical protein
LADPAGKYQDKKGGVEAAITAAIDAAEEFHTKHLGDYYHPNSYAFYGGDPNQLSFGHVRWVGRKQAGLRTVLTPANVAQGRPSTNFGDGARLVTIDSTCDVLFQPEAGDTRGDGTVPHQSGAGPAGKVQHLFETYGYDHRGSYNNAEMLMLTLRLVVRIVQGLP